MNTTEASSKIPVNGGSRPWKKIPPRVSWQEYQASKIPDIDDMEDPDAYTSKNRWEERIEI